MELVNKGITALKGECKEESGSLGNPCCGTLCAINLLHCVCA